jgi:predicted nucleic acid-binding protein
MAGVLADTHALVWRQDVAWCVGQAARSAVPDLPDRVIAATALRLNLPLVTRDSKIQAAGITTVW